MIACRCATTTRLAVFDTCQSFDSFNEMLLKLPQTLSNALTSQTGRAKEYGLDGAVMGWSDTERRVRLASFANENRFVLGFAPLVAAPFLSEQQFEECGIPVGGRNSGSTSVFTTQDTGAPTAGVWRHRRRSGTV